jgi:hypothetical protein
LRLAARLQLLHVTPIDVLLLAAGALRASSSEPPAAVGGAAGSFDEAVRGCVAALSAPALECAARAQAAAGGVKLRAADALDLLRGTPQWPRSLAALRRFAVLFALTTVAVSGALQRQALVALARAAVPHAALGAPLTVPRAPWPRAACAGTRRGAARAPHRPLRMRCCWTGLQRRRRCCLLLARHADRCRLALNALAATAGRDGRNERKTS